MVRLGWRQAATRLLLLDALVRSHMLFGAPVWAPKALNHVGAGRVGPLGRLCAFYRTA